MRTASEAALGYEQPNEIKEPEGPEGATLTAARTLEEVTHALGTKESDAAGDASCKRRVHTTR